MAYAMSNILKGSFLAVIFTVALLGNLFVAYILIKHRLLLLKNRPTYQFILNIILSDLVVGVLTIPFELVRELLDAWIFGTTLCKIVEFIEIAVSGTAVLTHALIAMDRYRSLAHPHLPRIKVQVVKQLIALSWIIPGVTSSPYLYMFHVLEVDAKLICTPKTIPVRWLDKLYKAVEFTVMLLLPFCVLCWCYFQVTLLMSGRNPHISAVSFSSTQSAISKSRKRVTRTAYLVAGAFFVCWLPTFVLRIVHIATGDNITHRGHTLHEISMFGAFTNEAINPVIYCAFDRNIRQTIRFSSCQKSRRHEDRGQNTADKASRLQELTLKNLEQSTSTAK